MPPLSTEHNGLPNAEDAGLAPVTLWEPGVAPPARVSPLAPGRGAVVWPVLIAVVVLLGAMSSGGSGALIFAGLSGLVVAALTLARGQLRWARLRSRGAGGAVAAGGLVLMVAGGVLAPKPDQAASPPLTSPTTATAAQKAKPTPSVTDRLVQAMAAASADTALAKLATLTVKDPAANTGYTRAVFGPEWQDVDHNGCDTRQDVLRRDLTKAVIKPGTGGCVATSGTLTDPYTGARVAYRHGGVNLSVDHVVSLANAWVSGAQKWTAAKRVQFANDPDNLQVVQAQVSKAKGDRDAAAWLPPRTAYRCAYVARQIAVKYRYGISVTPSERAAIGRVLLSCPTQHLPTTARVPTPVADARVPSKTTRQPAPTTPAPVDPAPPAEVYYANCTAARAAGAAPLYRGQPGYRPALDRDGDGIACE